MGDSLVNIQSYGRQKEGCAPTEGRKVPGWAEDKELGSGGGAVERDPGTQAREGNRGGEGFLQKIVSNKGFPSRLVTL